MIYIDSNIFIIAIAGDNKQLAAKAKALLAGIRDGRAPAVTSSLTLDEVVWEIKRAKGKDAAKMVGQAILEFPNLKIAAVDRNVLSLALELFDRYNLDPRDSIHAACAMVNNAEVIFSEDSDFDKIKELKRKHL